MALKQTPSQTVGPFFAYGLTAQQYGYDHTAIADGTMWRDGVPGERISIYGQVFDGVGQAVSDAMIELWQADGEGRFAGAAAGEAPPGNSAFSGFGRAGTGVARDCRFEFDTVKPGSAGPGRAPVISVAVFMRGLLSHVYTRIYFSDEASANASDTVLQTVPADRRNTLIAQRQGGPGQPRYRFDVHMQGPGETVFFDV